MIKDQKLKRKIKKYGISFILNFALLIFNFLSGSVYAAPPAPPMVIQGEIIAEGKEVPEGTELRISVKGQETTLKTLKSMEGISHYLLKIYAFNPNKAEKPGEVRAKDGDEIRFLSVGKYTLAQIMPLKWKQGLIVKKDIILNQLIQKPPVIVSASAVQAGDKLLLKCMISPVQQEKLDSSLVSYKIRWFYKKTKENEQSANDGRKPEEFVLVKEETLKGLKADKESELTFEGQVRDMKFLEVVVTPVMTLDGAKGPSAIKKVFPVITQGEI